MTISAPVSKANAIHLIDGGMGQELLKRSSMPAHPLWSAKVMMDEPDHVLAAHQDYVAAGARYLTLNTYTVEPNRLARDASIDLFEPLQQQAISLAKQAAQSSDNPVSLLGCLPPQVASYRPDLALPLEQALSDYRKIVEQQAPHVSVLLAETMGSIEQATAAVQAMKEASKPCWVALTLADTPDAEQVCLRSGENLVSAIEALMPLGPDALLVNCSKPEVCGQAMPILATSGIPFGGYANGFTSIDALLPGGTVDELKARQDLGPQAYAQIIMDWIDQGATIVGGCCEVGPAHIAELARCIPAAGYSLAEPI